MLERDVIIINKWYADTLKSSIKPKNTIDHVEVVQNKVDIQGWDRGKTIFINGRDDASFLHAAGYSELTDKKFLSGKNEEPKATGYKSISSQAETLGTLKLNFDNINHDENAENYTFVDILMKMQWQVAGRTTYAEFRGFQGSILQAATKGKRWDENFIIPTLTFSGNVITATFNDILLYGDYVIEWEESHGGGTQPMNFLPWMHSFGFVYGGFTLDSEKKIFGKENSLNSYEITKNGFFERSSKVGEKALAEHFSESVISSENLGRQFVEITVPMSDYKNALGDTLISRNGAKKTFRLFDKVALFEGGKSVYEKPNGEAKIFLVMQSSFVDDGERYFILKLLEEK